MDDDDYHKSLVARASVRTLDDVADYTWEECIEGFRQADCDMGSAFHRKLNWMNHAADAYFADKGKISGFLEPFAKDTGISYDYASQINRVRKNFSGCNPNNFSSDALKALLSAPKTLQEEFMSSEEPVKVKDVQQAKAGYKKVQDDPEYVDILQELRDKRKTPVEAAKEAWDRSEKKRKEIESRPSVFDLNAHIKSTEHCSVDVSATNLVVAMEQLISKFDKRDVMMYLYLAVQDDVLNIKIPALHEMSNILIELCEQLPLKGKINKNAN
jgi:hypothetical protein